MSLPRPDLNLTLVADGEPNVPLIIIYCAQVGLALLLLILMDFIPRTLGVLFVLAVAGGYPVSYALDIRVYEFPIDDPEWRNTFLKVCLVVFLATVPMVWYFQSQLNNSKWFGRFITTVLGLNILYTMLFEIGAVNVCGISRALSCVVMCLSLGIRVYIAEKKGIPVCYKTPKEPYTTVLLTPVTTLWVFAYTLWNISYSVAAFGVRTAIHILTLYIGVGYEYLKYNLEIAGPRAFLNGYRLDRTYVKITNDRAIHDTPDAPPLGWFFGYVRAITLGGYMALLPYLGMIPGINDTFVTFQINCDTEVAIYNVLTLILFLIDFGWVVLELKHIAEHDQRFEGNTEIKNGDDI